MLPLCKKQRKIIYTHAYFCKKKYKMSTKKLINSEGAAKWLQARMGGGCSDLSQSQLFRIILIFYICQKLNCNLKLMKPKTKYTQKQIKPTSF